MPVHYHLAGQKPQTERRQRRQSLLRPLVPGTLTPTYLSQSPDYLTSRTIYMLYKRRDYQCNARQLKTLAEQWCLIAPLTRSERSVYEKIHQHSSDSQ